MKPFYPTIAVAACMLAAGAGCTRTLYVPTTTTSTTDTRAATERADTLIVLDSVVTEPRGDTVYHTRVRTVYRTACRRDTLTVCRTDTVTVPVEVIAADSRASRSATLWRRLAFGTAVLAALFFWLLRRR